MKTLLPIVLVLCFLHAHALTKLELSSALNAKSVKANFTRTGDTSEMYNDCIAIAAEIQNLTTDDVQLNIPAGTHLLASDETIQNMLVVETQVVAISKGGTGSVILHAFCTNHQRQGPDYEQSYILNSSPDAKLTALGAFIGANKYFTHPAQATVWAFSDNEPLATIYDDDEATVMALRNYAGKQLGVPVPKFTEAMVGREQIHIIDTAYYSGKIWFSMPTTGKASLILYDENKNVLRTLCNFDALKPGEYTYTFHITDAELAGRRAYFELNLIDRFKREIPMATHTSNRG